MAQAPAKDKRREEKDNIFVDILYNIVVYLPILAISWVIDKFSD